MARAIWRCKAISLPWSQVSDRRSCAGIDAIAWVIAAATAAGSRLCGRCSSSTNLVVHSTRVPIAEALPAPMIRSPSQWPGTARSAASAGRSLISTMSLIRPRRSPALRRGLRSARPVRRHEASSRRNAPRPCT